ncbi:putative isomerase YbhE [Auriculariales sp. MPI-PUGE-AT-0066]|nr:putative isomerase YbhE [Auriculariales sp. MPI-PUGE-AT-0066]
MVLARRGISCSVIVLLTWAGLAAGARVSRRATTYTLLAGGYTTSITTLTFDPAVAAISVVGTCDSGANPSWLTSHPTVKTVQYSTNEYDAGLISSFTTADPKRICTKVNSASAAGDAPAHVAVVRSGSEIIAANYNSGTVGIYTLSADKLNFVNGSKISFSANVSHPHEVVEYGQEVFIPDLGADKIWRFIGQPTGSGPRHIATKGNVVFVLHELANTLAAQFIDFAPTNTTNPYTISSLSLILSPDGKYLYASNRDTDASPDPRGDAIAIVKVGSYGSLTLVKHVFTGLQLLRGLSLSPDAKYLIGGGQAAGGVVAWQITNGGADLKEVARNSAGPAATGFTWLS